MFVFIAAPDNDLWRTERFFLIKLNSVQTQIQRTGLQQFIMGTDIHHSALIQNHNLIRFQDR
jgi:hypothetical protein